MGVNGILQYIILLLVIARKNGCKACGDSNAYACVVADGHLETLKWVRQNGVVI